ncbi:hypothetical protein P7K49_018033, partial [Saguinus oedipus]
MKAAQPLSSAVKDQAAFNIGLPGCQGLTKSGPWDMAPSKPEPQGKAQQSQPTNAYSQLPTLIGVGSAAAAWRGTALTVMEDSGQTAENHPEIAADNFMSSEHHPS